MLDLHCHLLPGIDDGSDCRQTSAAMLESLATQGVTQVAATPHFYPQRDNPEAFLRRRGESLRALQWAGAPEILPGAEVAYFSGLSRCQELKQLAIGDTGLLLVEMPFSPWTGRMVEELFRISEDMQLTPVLAHVERYRGKDQLPRFLQELAERGVLLQCNAQAFLSFASRRWALSMVKAGYVRFLGTDAHNMTLRAPRYSQAAEWIGKKLGQDALREITRTI